jgi:hypothetical protein
MSSIYDIPYKDIKKFLLANRESFKNKNDAYDIALDLLKDKETVGHTTSIIEWIIAHNLLIKKVDIPNYTIEEINNMTQTEINKLAKKLTMTGNNINNIKNILRYLHKLDERKSLLPEIENIIFDTLAQLELKDIDVFKLNAYDVIDLLKNHRNKKIIREFIYDNMQNILSYNFLNTDFDILTDNKKKLIKRYDIEEKDIHKNMNFIYYKRDTANLDLVRINMDILAHFIVKLLEINEIELVKRAIFLINEYEFPRGFPLNYYLTEKLIYSIDDINIIMILINIIGEKIFIEQLEKNIQYNQLQQSHISSFLEKLAKSENYDLLVKSIQILIDKDYTGNGKIINKILQGIKKAIRTKNDDLIIRYIDIIGTMSFLNTVKSGNRQTNSRKLEKFNQLIKEAEENK